MELLGRGTSLGKVQPPLVLQPLYLNLQTKALHDPYGLAQLSTSPTSPPQTEANITSSIFTLLVVHLSLQLSELSSCSGDWVHLFSPLGGCKCLEVRDGLPISVYHDLWGLRPTGQLTNCLCGGLGRGARSRGSNGK